MGSAPRLPLSITDTAVCSVIHARVHLPAFALGLLPLPLDSCHLLWKGVREMAWGPWGFRLCLFGLLNTVT